MVIVPLHSLVVMVGPSGAGKSTFIESNFPQHEVVSMDAIRRELTGDIRNQHVNDAVYREFRHRIKTKLAIGERVVADATHIKKEDRLETAGIGVDAHVPVFYVVVDRPLDEKLADGGWRLNEFIKHKNLIEAHHDIFMMNQNAILSGDNGLVSKVIDTRTFEKLHVIKKFNFDNIEQDIRDRGFEKITVIGDVHGMIDDFNHHIDEAKSRNNLIIQLGDVVDYGPDSVKCVSAIYDLVMNGEAIFIIGNHERKLERYIQQFQTGEVRLKLHGGILKTVEQLNKLSDKNREIFNQKFTALMNSARFHVRVGNSIFAHGAITTKMWNIVSNRLDGKHLNRAIFGETDGNNKDEEGFPIRLYNWIDEIENGRTAYVGHAYLDLYNPVTKVGKLGGKAVFVDTGSGKEGTLSSIVVKIS
jgi:protein phosphatase